jgi:hypothetical protein
VPNTEAPHAPQNFSPGWQRLPQLGHAASSGAPHSTQNVLFGRFS